MFIYSIFDRKAHEYGNLVIGPNDGFVKRSLVEGIPQSNGIMKRYPEDFDLMCVGMYELETGLVQGTPPRLIGSIKEIVYGSARTLQVVEDPSERVDSVAREG